MITPSFLEDGFCKKIDTKYGWLFRIYPIFTFVSILILLVSAMLAYTKLDDSHAELRPKSRPIHIPRFSPPSRFLFYLFQQCLPAQNLMILIACYGQNLAPISS